MEVSYIIYTQISFNYSVNVKFLFKFISKITNIYFPLILFHIKDNSVTYFFSGIPCYAYTSLSIFLLTVYSIITSYAYTCCIAEVIFIHSFFEGNKNREKLNHVCLNKPLMSTAIYTHII